MKCTKCDHELNSDAVFCPMCGTPVTGEKDSIADDIDEELEPTVLLSDVQDEIAPTVLLTPEELEKSSALADAVFTDNTADAALPQEPSGGYSPTNETGANETETNKLETYEFEINETELPKKAGISPVIPIVAIIIILIIIMFF